MITVAVLGLGEAGSEIARDLVAAGATVRAYDPVVDALPGTIACHDDADAVRGADVVLSVNTASDAESALKSGLSGISGDVVWADMNTAAPGLEDGLAAAAEAAGVLFADVALMAPVPGRGLRTPTVVSGTGAARYAELLGPLGAQVEVLDGPAGAASTRKLLRSVFFKGMAAAVIEALHASRAVGLEDWMRDLIATEIEHAGADFARRMEEGTYLHAARRAEEMAAATDLLTALGVPPRIASASHDWLVDLQHEKP